MRHVLAMPAFPTGVRLSLHEINMIQRRDPQAWPMLRRKLAREVWWCSHRFLAHVADKDRRQRMKRRASVRGRRQREWWQ